MGVAADRGPVVITRYPSDVFRVVIGTVLFGLCVLIAHEVAASHLQRNVSRLANDLPHFFNGPAGVTSGAGAVTVVVTVVVLLARRQWRALLASC